MEERALSMLVGTINKVKDDLLGETFANRMYPRYINKIYHSITQKPQNLIKH